MKLKDIYNFIDLFKGGPPNSNVWLVRSLVLNPKCTVVTANNLESEQLLSEYNKSVSDAGIAIKMFRATLGLQYITPKFITYSNLDNKVKKENNIIFTPKLILDLIK